MLNEEKIKIMNKLAMYEQGEGKKYLPVSKYYRSDYIGLALIKNFFPCDHRIWPGTGRSCGIFRRIPDGEYS